MGKEISCIYKNNWSKLSTPKLKKADLSSSDSHTSSASHSKRTSISPILDNKNIITNQNKNNTSNTDDIQSCVTPWKQNHSVQTTSATTHLTTLNATLHIASIKLHTTTKLLPPHWWKILVFQINKKIISGCQVFQLPRTTNICQ